MMYCTVLMYGLDGRLSPLSYNYVCRVSIVEKKTNFKSTLKPYFSIILLKNVKNHLKLFEISFHEA